MKIIMLMPRSGGGGEAGNQAVCIFFHPIFKVEFKGKTAKVRLKGFPDFSCSRKKRGVCLCQARGFKAATCTLAA